MLTSDDQAFALPLRAVRRVIRAVEVVPLPHSPPSVIGVINLQGDVIAVLSLRKATAAREVEPDDQFVITETAGQVIALWVDSTDVGKVLSASIAPPLAGSSEFDFARNVLKLNGALVPLLDVETLLSADDRVKILQGMEALHEPATTERTFDAPHPSDA